VGSTSDAEIDRLFDAGAILRTHVMRPTWHFVDPADIRWLLELTAPRVHQANAYQYRLQGIDAETAMRSRAVMERALEGGRSLTRPEIGRLLTDGGIPAAGIRLGYLIGHAELERVLCSGPRRGKQQTYALLDERVQASPATARTHEEALAELARRYVEGHGPAQVADLSWWSGLTVAESRRALGLATPPLRVETIGERTFWLDPDAASTSSPDPARPAVHLLPNYDELLIAFRDRSDAVDPELPAPARVAEVILAHVIARDGLVVGGWRRSADGSALRVSIDLMVRLSDEEQGALTGAVDRLSAFVGRPVEAGWASPHD
jgi:hypothetical protein